MKTSTKLPAILRRARRVARRNLGSLAALPEGLRYYWAGSVSASVDADVANGRVTVIDADAGHRR